MARLGSPTLPRDSPPAFNSDSDYPMKTSRTILLFEDDKDERPGIIAALEKALPTDVKLVSFVGAGTTKTGTYETRILKDFSAQIGRAEMIICDQDLSLFND